MCITNNTLHGKTAPKIHKQKGLYKSNTEENKEIQKEKRASEQRIRGNPTKHQLN